MSPSLTADRSAVRLAVYRHFVETATAPAVEELARVTGLEEPGVRSALTALQDLHALALDPRDGSVAMAHPFSAFPTPYAAETAHARYYANCLWDALAMPALLRSGARIDAACAETGEPLPMRLDADGGGLDGPGADGVAHLVVPFWRFWEDVFFT